MDGWVWNRPRRDDGNRSVTASPLRHTGTPLSPNVVGVTDRRSCVLDYMAIGRIAIVLPRPAAPSRRRVIQEVLVAWSTGKSMRCQNCSAENPQGANFCIQCATPLRRRCQKCGFENPPEARFCAQCATSLTGDQVGQPSNAAAGPASSGIRVATDSSEPQSLEGERKTVTALFADIKGSTELMRDLDPEEARAIVDPVLQLMMAAVHRYGGYVAQSTGDGIFAIFGAPVAHEDHPQRALHAALAIQEELRRYADRLA